MTGPVPDLDRVSRMYSESCDLLIDADILRGASLHRERGSISDYLLRLLAFEVLLKASVWLNGQVPANDHGYLAHWRQLPEQLGGEIQTIARNRLAGPDGARLNSLHHLLPTYSKLFTEGRYYFDLGNTTDHYYSQELDALIHALEAHIRRSLPSARPDAVAP